MFEWKRNSFNNVNVLTNNTKANIIRLKEVKRNQVISYKKKVFNIETMLIKRFT